MNILLQSSLPDYVLHGHTLVGLVSLSMPPQPQTHNGVFRLLTQNPALRFVPGEEQTINIWDYEGLGEGSPPDDTQIALVVGDLLHLMGLEEGTTEARYKGAVCEEVARAVFNNVAHMNGAGRERREPTLSDFLSLLENFPYAGTELAHAQEINTLLKRYRGHAWLDAPTSAVFQGTSRFDVYELDSLELLLADVKSTLAYRVAARIIVTNATGRFVGCGC